MRFTSIPLLLLLAACSSTPPKNVAVFNVQSNPPGATISSGNKSFGVAPVTITAKLNEGQTAASGPITATWVSGAKATERVTAPGGERSSHTINRPAGAPGLNQDLQWAMQLQQREDAASALILRQINADADREAQRQLIESQRNQQRGPVNCNTTYYGNQAQTTCY